MLPIKHLINWLSIKAGFLAACWSAAFKCAWTLCHNLPRSWHLIKWITLLVKVSLNSPLFTLNVHLPSPYFPIYCPVKLFFTSSLLSSSAALFDIISDKSNCEIWSLTRSHVQTHACGWVFQCHKKPSSFSTKYLNVLPLKKQMFTSINPEKWTELLKCSAI